MIIFRPPTEADIAHVAEHMREMDKRECRVLGDSEPLEALRHGVEISLWSYAAEVDGRTIAIFGVSGQGLVSEDGSPWLLSIDGIERYARAVLIGSKIYRARMREDFETLSNYVHAHNRNSIRYLKWCGFEFGEEIMVEGEPFLPFFMVCREPLKQAA